ncbi:hypothetical protein PV433_27200 [Paenibacillus sp. GYB004]|uniref:hypothetical protein n=1 Tax=Paenibacillus sp. GYB004 TaxID=2994393 RepID=UPI002F9661AB
MSAAANEPIRTIHFITGLCRINQITQKGGSRPMETGDRNIVVERNGAGYRVRYETKTEESARDIGAIIIVLAGIIAVAALVN